MYIHTKYIHAIYTYYIYTHTYIYTGIEDADSDDDDDDSENETDKKLTVNITEVKKYIKLSKDSLEDIYTIVKPILNK